MCKIKHTNGIMRALQYKLQRYQCKKRIKKDNEGNPAIAKKYIKFKIAGNEFNPIIFHNMGLTHFLCLTQNRVY